jgi:hypothetical protein
MKSVEAQLWEQALDAERRRVEQVHNEAEAKGKKSTVIYEPRNVAKPWSWESRWKVSLHDISAGLVMKVSEFDFNLDDDGFQAFLKPCGLLHLGGVPQSAYWQAMNDPNMDKAAFLAVEDFRFAQEHEGKRHRYSDAEMKTRWRIFQFSRVMLQAAWDAYTGRKRPETAEEILSEAG